MAKKPASPKATPKSVGKVAPPDLVGADVGGESPQKASPVPEDAEISFSYTEPQADGGETHQVADDRIATLTTQQGIPVADDQNSRSEEHTSELQSLMRISDAVFCL